MLIWSTTSRPGFAAGAAPRVSGTAVTTASSTGWALGSRIATARSPAPAGRAGPAHTPAAMKVAATKRSVLILVAEEHGPAHDVVVVVDPVVSEPDLVLVAHVHRPAGAQGEAQARAQDVRRGVDLVREGIRAERRVGHDRARRREDLGVPLRGRRDVSHAPRVAAEQHERRGRLEIRAGRERVGLLVEDVGGELRGDGPLVVGRAAIEGIVCPELPPVAEALADAGGDAVIPAVTHVVAILKPPARHRDADPGGLGTQSELPAEGRGRPREDVIEPVVALVE